MVFLPISTCDFRCMELIYISTDIFRPYLAGTFMIFFFSETGFILHRGVSGMAESGIRPFLPAENGN